LRPLAQSMKKELTPSAAGTVTASLSPRNSLNWGRWWGGTTSALTTTGGNIALDMCMEAAASVAAAIRAAAAATATAAAEVLVAVAAAPARTSVAASATVTGLPAVAASLPEASVKAAHALVNHAVTIGGCGFAGLG